MKSSAKQKSSDTMCNKHCFLLTDMQDVLHVKKFDYYMDRAQQQIQDDLVDRIWQARCKKSFSKHAVSHFER